MRLHASSRHRFAPVTLLVAACAALPTAAASEDQPKWGAHIDLEGKLGTDRSLGEADLFAPLWQDNSSLLFADIRVRLDDDNSTEGNFGLGYRHMLANGWNLGGYGYFDLRRSDHNNTFRQITLGLEALSADWDLRTNAYLPVGDRSKDLGTRGGAPFADLNGTTIEVVTPGGVRREERALGGFDTEVGWRLPLFAAADMTQLRVYGGGFWFDDAVADAIAGPRARLELTLDEVPGLWEGARLTLGGEVQHDDVRDTQAFASLRLRIPLQAAAARGRLSAQERRMTDPVVRDIDIVAQAAEHRTPERREAAINPATGQPYGPAIRVTAAEDYKAAVTDAGANAVIVADGADGIFNNATSIPSA
jgi:hypothetical protein